MLEIDFVQNIQTFDILQNAQTTINQGFRLDVLPSMFVQLL